MLANPRALHWSTDEVAPPHRIEYWNDKNTAVLVGLESSTFSHDGLWAAQSNFDLDGCRLADIRGNQHVIERTPDMVRRQPKGSVFASLVVQSNAFFYQGRDCFTLGPGDLMLYNTDRPYVFGFTQDMRQLLFDIPYDAFTQHCQPQGLSAPIKLDGHASAGHALLAALRLNGLQFAQDSQSDSSNALRHQLFAVLNTLLARQAGACIDSSHAGHLVTAKSYISQHLQNPHLSPESVAAAIGISTRHLNRLFALEQLSAARYIKCRRLSAARNDLSNPALSGFSIAEIGHRWGFPSSGHFSRAFKQEYAISPSSARSASI